MRVDSDSMYLILYALMMLSAMAERLFKISKNWIWKHTSTTRFIWGSHFLLLYYGRMPFPSEGRHSCSRNRRGDLACDMYNLSQMWVQSEIIIACPQQFFFFMPNVDFALIDPGRATLSRWSWLCFPAWCSYSGSPLRVTLLPSCPFTLPPSLSLPRNQRVFLSGLAC